jgi:hypothetical protein
MRATDPRDALIRLIRSNIHIERKTRFQIEHLTFSRLFYPAFPPLPIASWHEYRLITPHSYEGRTARHKRTMTEGLLRPFWGRRHHFDTFCHDRLFPALSAQAGGRREFAAECHLLELLGRVRPDPFPVIIGEEPLRGHDKLLNSRDGALINAGGGN